MSTSATKSITWLWIASLFIATVGVSGQQIYCYCLGKTSFSLFVAEDACVDKEDSASKNCCTSPQSNLVANCCEKRDPGHNCTKKTTKVFQLKAAYTLQEKKQEQTASFSIDQDLSCVSIFVCQNISRCQNNGFQPLANAPPPLSGRMICVRHGVFRC